VILAVSGGSSLAADPTVTTTLAPISVHASDSMVMETPSVQVRVTRRKLQQQNVTESADALKYAPNMMVR
jgi:iron complex outermembrane receptor protein